MIRSQPPVQDGWEPRATAGREIRRQQLSPVEN